MCQAVLQLHLQQPYEFSNIVSLYLSIILSEENIISLRNPER